jgi:hypothetical protein
MMTLKKGVPVACRACRNFDRLLRHPRSVKNGRRARKQIPINL